MANKTIIKAYSDKAGTSIGVTDLAMSGTLKVDAITNKVGTSAPSILGISDGSSVTAGNIGEIKEVILSANYTTTGTEADITGLSLSLTAGVWLVEYNLGLEVGHGVSVGNGLIRMSSLLTDSSNVRVSGSGATVSTATHPTAASNTGQNISKTSVINISSTDTYKVRGYYTLKNATGGGATVYSTTGDADTNALRTDSYLRAIRIG